MSAPETPEFDAFWKSHFKRELGLTKSAEQVLADTTGEYFEAADLEFVNGHPTLTELTLNRMHLTDLSVLNTVSKLTPHTQ